MHRKQNLDLFLMSQRQRVTVYGPRICVVWFLPQASTIKYWKCLVEVSAYRKTCSTIFILAQRPFPRDRRNGIVKQDFLFWGCIQWVMGKPLHSIIYVLHNKSEHSYLGREICHVFGCPQVETTTLYDAFCRILTIFRHLAGQYFM